MYKENGYTGLRTLPGNLPLHIIGLNERGFALAKELVNELVELRPTQDNIIHNLDVFSKAAKPSPI